MDRMNPRGVMEAHGQQNIGSLSMVAWMSVRRWEFWISKVWDGYSYPQDESCEKVAVPRLEWVGVYNLVHDE